MSSKFKHAPSVIGASPAVVDLGTACSTIFCSGSRVDMSTSPRCLSAESASSIVLQRNSVSGELAEGENERQTLGDG